MDVFPRCSSRSGFKCHKGLPLPPQAPSSIFFSLGKKCWWARGLVDLKYGGDGVAAAALISQENGLWSHINPGLPD